MRLKIGIAVFDSDDVSYAAMTINRIELGTLTLSEIQSLGGDSLKHKTIIFWIKP